MVMEKYNEKNKIKGVKRDLTGVTKYDESGRPWVGVEYNTSTSKNDLLDSLGNLDTDSEIYNVKGLLSVSLGMILALLLCKKMSFIEMHAEVLGNKLTHHLKLALKWPPLPQPRKKVDRGQMS